MSVQRYILSEWAEELGTRFGRPKEDILNHGLSATDFKAREELEISFRDGSKAHFQYAFFIASKTRRRIAVFTEHCGYHEFPYFDVEIQQIVRSIRFPIRSIR